MTNKLLKRQTPLRALLLSGALAAGAAGLVGCQEINQPTTTLTQAQWQEVKSNLLEDAPEVQYPVGANFDDKIEFIGFDIDKPLVAGQPITVTWYWKALADLKDNWQVFVHLDASEKSYRQHLDHHPMDGLYQTGRWKKDQIIKDIQKVTVNRDYPAGQAVPYIGFYKGDKRLPIKNEVKKTQDNRVIGPALVVKNDAQKKEAASLPTYEVGRVDDKELARAKIDGKLDEAFWESAEPVMLAPLGSAPDLKTEVRVVRGSEHLYIGATLPDEHIWSTLEKRDADLWTEEVFEVYIDTDRSGEDYLELQINPLGTIFDARFEQQLGRGEGSRQEQIDRARAWDMEGLESAVAVEGTINDDSDKDKAWSVELKLPFSAIPGAEGAPKDGDTWAVNFYRFDRPEDKVSHAYAWSKPTTGDFHQFERFGDLKFGAAAGSEKPTRSVEAKTLQLNQPDNSTPRLKLNPDQMKNLQKKVEERREKRTKD